MFRRYLRAAGLAPSWLHILRHSAAKLRRDAGASIAAVSSFLDHSSLAVTSVYLRRLEGDATGRGPLWRSRSGCEQSSRLERQAATEADR